MQTIQNSAFKEKAAPVEDVSKLLPEAGAVVLNKLDGRLYAADKWGWHRFGDPYSPVVIFFQFDGTNQMSFDMALPVDDVVNILWGDGSETEIVGLGETSYIATPSAFTSAGPKYVSIIGSVATITRIRFVSPEIDDIYGSITGMAEMENLVRLQMNDHRNIYGDVGAFKDHTTLQWFLVKYTSVSGDVSLLYKNTGMNNVNIQSPNVTFDNVYPWTGHADSQIFIGSKLNPNHIDNAIIATSAAATSKIVLCHNEKARSHNSNPHILTSVKNGNVLSVREDGNTLNCGPELHVGPDAISDRAGTEANSIVGWNEVGLNGTGDNKFISQRSRKVKGAFAFEILVTTPTANAAIDKDYTVLVGDIIRHSFMMRDQNYSDRILGSWMVEINGVNTNVQSFSDVFGWANFTIYTLSDAVTDTIKFIEWGSSNDGGIFLDDLSVRTVNDPQ